MRFPFNSSLGTLKCSRRADYADDEYIQELIHWKHPHTIPHTEIEYSEEENLTMLRLPRRECEHYSFTYSEAYLPLPL